MDRRVCDRGTRQMASIRMGKGHHVYRFQLNQKSRAKSHGADGFWLTIAEFHEDDRHRVFGAAPDCVNLHGMTRCELASLRDLISATLSDGEVAGS
jgi:hypothetical protein